MIGGIGILVGIGLVSKALATYGFEKVFWSTVKGLEKKGTSRAQIVAKVRRYPISKDMKAKILYRLGDEPDQG